MHFANEGVQPYSSLHKRHNSHQVSRKQKAGRLTRLFAFRGATTCFLSNSASSGRRDNFAAFGVEETLGRFTRAFIILNDQAQ